GAAEIKAFLGMGLLNPHTYPFLRMAYRKEPDKVELSRATETEKRVFLSQLQRSGEASELRWENFKTGVKRLGK
ncbi:MAG TPA: hypothetical protein VI874_03950, partial [Candidatus Norongarragalinales archaeon]|nr:hypothetical protein [Candidatus Norongarragalinales archaeon]